MREKGKRVVVGSERDVELVSEKQTEWGPGNQFRSLSCYLTAPEWLDGAKSLAEIQPGPYLCDIPYFHCRLPVICLLSVSNKSITSHSDY